MGICNNKTYFKNQELVGFTAIRTNITDKKYIEHLSITDELTQLYNRRFFNIKIVEEINRAKRENNHFSFLIMDVDFFKQYNDTYGHQKGDLALERVANLLRKKTSRASDFAFRLGGEEFGIITSKLEENEIIEYVKTIKNSIDNLKIVHKNSPFNYISVSIGVCNLDKNDKKTCPEIYYLADKALYTAKNKGRNQICYEP